MLAGEQTVVKNQRKKSQGTPYQSKHHFGFKFFFGESISGKQKFRIGVVRDMNFEMAKKALFTA